MRRLAPVAVVVAPAAASAAGGATANGGPGGRFTKVGFLESGCAACHAQAQTNDDVFTRG